MGGSYRQCVECGKRALSFATRCPGCGIELPNPAPFGHDAIPERTRFLSVKLVVPVVALGALLTSFTRGPSTPAPLIAETAVVATLPGDTATLAVDSPAATARRDTMTVATPAPGAAGVPLIAKGWTHVQSRRTVNSTLEAVLTPGDTVVCDSLVNGWYRVALYGEVLGYARQTTLVPTRP